MLRDRLLSDCVMTDTPRRTAPGRDAHAPTPLLRRLRHMADSSGIPTVVSELEGAGVLGAAAISLLAPFFGGPPGTAVSTGTGFVWTKTVLSGAEGTSVSLGALGRLKIDSGAISVTLAANWYGPRAEVDILFQLERRPGADAGAEPERLPGRRPGHHAGRIGRPHRLRPLDPRAGRDPAAGVGARVQLPPRARRRHRGVDPDLPPGLLSGTEGIFEWTPEGNKLLVFRKLFDIAFGVQKLFVDLSATNGVADFKSRFADVYTASWKGIGAQRIDVVVPVEDMFFNASAEGFLVDFDGNFTGDFSLAWQNPAGEIIKAIDAEISLRENEPRRGEIGVTVDLNGVKEAADRPAAGRLDRLALHGRDRARRARQAGVRAPQGRSRLRRAGALLGRADLRRARRRRTAARRDGLRARPDRRGDQGRAGQHDPRLRGRGGGRRPLDGHRADRRAALHPRRAGGGDASDALAALGMVFLADRAWDDEDDEEPTSDHAPAATHHASTSTRSSSATSMSASRRRWARGRGHDRPLHPAAGRARASTSARSSACDCRVTDLIDRLLSAVDRTSGSNLIGLFGSTLESAEIQGNLELEFGNLFLRFRHTEAHATAEGPVEAAFDIFPRDRRGARAPPRGALARRHGAADPRHQARAVRGRSSIPRPVTEIKAVRTG